MPLLINLNLSIINEIQSSAAFNATSTPDTNWPALLLVLFIFSGVFGNTLVCIAVSTERRLQNVTNYFLLSLSVADLLVSTFVMPFSILTVLHYGKWELGFTLCAVHCYTDVFLCSASIVHMTAISLDRYLGISRPLKTRNKSKLIVVLKIFIVWILTIVISCPLAVVFIFNPDDIYMKNDADDGDFLCQINNRYYMIYGSTLAFLIPFVIMLITYVRTTKLLKKQAQLLSGYHVVAGGDKNSTKKNNHNSFNEGLRRTRTKRSSSKISRQLQKQQTPSFEEDNTSQTNSVYSERTYLSTATMNAIRAATNVIRHSVSADDAETLFGFHLTTTPQRKPSPRSLEMRPFLQNDNNEQQSTTSNLKPTRLSSKFLTTKTKQRRVAVGGAGDVNLHSSSSAADVANEQKATRVLGLVFACFFICWTPFFALNFTYAFCAEHCQAPYLIEMIFLWLGFVSSTVNPIIYTVFNKRFRQAFARIVRCRWKRVKYSSANNSTSITFTHHQRNSAISRTNSQQTSYGRNSQKISSGSAVGSTNAPYYSNGADGAASRHLLVGNVNSTLIIQ